MAEEKDGDIDSLRERGNERRGGEETEKWSDYTCEQAVFVCG